MVWGNFLTPNHPPFWVLGVISESPEIGWWKKKKGCVPCACGASSSHHQRSSILWEHFLKMLRTEASPGTFGYHDLCLLIRRLTPTTACGRPPKCTMYSLSLIRRNSGRAWGTCVSPPEATRRSFAGGFARSAKFFFLDHQQNFFKTQNPGGGAGVEYKIK